MTLGTKNLEKFLARMRQTGGGFADIYARSAAVAVLLFASSLFMLYAAVRIAAECVANAPVSSNSSTDSEAVDEAKRFALDRALYEDFVKAGDVAGNNGAAVILSPVFPANFSMEAADARGLPGYVPTVVLRALAVLGGESVCVLDIDGEEAGKIYRAGESFGGGNGRVVKINADGVTWRWADREYAAGL